MSKPSITDYRGAERERTALRRHPNDISGRWSDCLERDIANRLLATDQDWSDPLE
ncbi:hypothetical protein SAMN05443582_104187 [Phyllobacterium sp. OV277]|nr:hypothetical protein SAMN05443582_104187 [Phyllobacterium sp. OV277]